MRLWVFLGLTLFAVELQAFDFDERLRSEITSCQAIDPEAYQSGLWMNPGGFQSYYKRSACYQSTAEKFRQEDLCDEVKRRWALFSSSWGYSESHCRKLVKAGKDEDRRRLESLRTQYLAGPVRLIEFRVEKNGNRRDYDFVPTFSDGMPAGYTVQVYLRGQEKPLLTDGFHLTGSKNNIRIFRRRTELPGIQPGQRYDLEVRVSLSIGPGRPRGWLRADLLDEVFPLSERTQIFETTGRF